MTIPQGPTKDQQRTAKELYGLSCRKLAPVRAEIFHMLPDLVENLHFLIASSTQRQTAQSVDVEISFFVSVIRSIGSP